MTKYIVFVNEFNPNSNETVSFEVTFDSLKEVTKYISHFHCEQHCNGHVEKWVKNSNDKDFISSVILNF